MPTTSPTRLRVAAIAFLNPAPLLYDFEHDPAAATLRTRYTLHYTSPAQCAAQLHTGAADLGLIPIGALPFSPGLVAVPGCTIASLHEVRSIQLVLRPGLQLQDVRTVAADTASRSSVAYTQILFRAFYNNDPTYTEAPASLASMLATNDAALLIGDPALLALEHRDDPALTDTEALRDHTWIDVASLWNQHTGLPWVAAVWAVRPQALPAANLLPTQLQQDLTGSRDAGLAHIDQLIQQWTPRIALPPDTIRIYLTRNIHYTLDTPCLAAVARFYELAHDTRILPAYSLPFLDT